MGSDGRCNIQGFAALRLPWVTGHPDRRSPVGAGFLRGRRIDNGPNSTGIFAIRRPKTLPVSLSQTGSEPLQGSGRVGMSLTQGSRGAANPGLSKTSPSDLVHAHPEFPVPSCISICEGHHLFLLLPSCPDLPSRPPAEFRFRKRQRRSRSRTSHVH